MSWGQFIKMLVIRKNLGASVVGALATLPQAVAYGLIAVSPLGTDWAVFGITSSVGAAILFGFGFAVFGSNAYMVSGPSAITALVMASGIQISLERGYSPIEALILASSGIVLAGLFQVVAGLLRMGHVVSYVPVPVLSGFVNASAVLVFFSALPMMLGVSDMTLSEILINPPASISLWAMVVSGITAAVCFLPQKLSKFVPTALLGLLAGAMAYYVGTTWFALPEGLSVGEIDVASLWRMPLLLGAQFQWGMIWSDIDIPLMTGLSIGLLSSFNTVITSSAISLRTDSEYHVNFDLRLHGLLNMLMGFLTFLPSSGALSRSSVIIDAGGTGRAANIGSALVFTAMLVVLAPLIANLPLWSTSGLLAATALLAIDRPTMGKIWSVVTRRVAYPRVLLSDIAISVVVVAAALVFDLIVAVGVGLAMSVLLFVLGMGRNPIRRAFSGSRIHSKIQRSISQSGCLEREGHRVAVVELQGALFFGSCARLQRHTKALLSQGIEYLILDCRHLTSIDSSGAAMLRTLHLMLAEAGGRLIISYIEPERRNRVTNKTAMIEIDGKLCRREKSPPRWVWLNLEANGVVYAVGENNFFDDTNEALAHCEELLLMRFGIAERERGRGVIANSALFDDMTRQQIGVLGAIAKRHHFGTGEAIFRQGDNADRAYFLVFGRVDVLIDIAGTDRKKRVSVLTEGTVFGEVGLIDGSPRSASVLASCSSHCYSIDATHFKRLQANHPDLVAALLVNLSRLFASRLRLANIMISELEQ